MGHFCVVLQDRETGETFPIADPDVHHLAQPEAILMAKELNAKTSIDTRKYHYRSMHE